MQDSSENKHPVWLANPVLVPKKTYRLRMCIDYSDPKDAIPLPHIDQVMDSTACIILLYFLNATQDDTK
jgi:hypothetical protein